MALQPGSRIGPYEIVTLIGRGAMGEVYRARDLKLNREVAIKVLPDHLALDPARLSWLHREAQVLASLNHPHIAHIHGLEDSSGVPALVLELVEGPTLADRIAKGPLPVRDALVIARQICEALEAAHDRHVIHRDLKPANIKIGADGGVKVLDFGLAKAAAGDAEAHDLSLVPTQATIAGSVVGTAPYMSPEQARGLATDARTDIWAFGCVLFEMLTGHRPFEGATLSDTLASVLTRDPNWSLLPAGTPAGLRRVLRRCLEKDLKRRLRHIGDVRIDLEDAADAGSTDAATPAPVTRRTAISVLAGAALGAAATGALVARRSRDAAPRRLLRIPIALPEGTTALASSNRRVAISPDGTRIAFNVGALNQTRLYLRSLDELETRVLPVPIGINPFFSPDGQSLGFFGNPTGLRKIGLGGGAPVLLHETEASTGGAWADDDTIYFVSGSPGPVLRIAAAGGQAEEAIKIDSAKGERGHRHPCVIPGTQIVLFTASTADGETFDDARIVAMDIKTGRRKTLVEGGSHPRYSPSGHVVYARAGSLLAVRFDPARFEVSGQPFTVLEGVLMSVNSGAANFDISASGDLVYIPGPFDEGERTLVWVDRQGNAEALPLPSRPYLHPRLSPDGRQLAVEIEGPNHDFYVYDFARAVLTKMTTDGESHWPVWSADGSRLAYRSGHMQRWRMWQMPADRSRNAEQLPGVGISQSAESWSPDGRAIAYTATTQEPGSNIMVASLEDQQSRTLVNIKAPAGSPKFSPDGKWLAYCSNESGAPQVYVQAFPGPGAKIQVSAESGTDPVWKGTGGELYFRDGDRMMAVSVSSGATFAAGRPQVLWEGHYSHGMSASCGLPGATSSNYDVTPDGQRFVMIKDQAPDRAFSKQIVVALGWSNDLSQRQAEKA